MAWTYQQKMDASVLSLKGYRDALPSGDPDLPSANAHVQYRDDLDAYGAACRLSAKSGPGSNPPGPPPPPPGV